MNDKIAGRPFPFFPPWQPKISTLFVHFSARPRFSPPSKIGISATTLHDLFVIHRRNVARPPAPGLVRWHCAVLSLPGPAALGVWQ